MRVGRRRTQTQGSGARNLLVSVWSSKRQALPSYGIASFTYLVEIPGQWTEQTGILLTGIAKGFRTLSFVFIYLFKWNVRIQFQRGICAWQIQMFYCDQICKVNLAFIHRHMSLEFLMGGLVHSFYKYRIIRTKYQYCSLRMTRCLVHT